MRAAIHKTFGHPPEVLALGEASVPQPVAGQVRIKTILSPIHNHDLWTIRGEYGYKPQLPAIGGSEAVGTVDALGEGVTGIAIGQRVACVGVHGTWAEYFLAPAQGLIPLPDAVPDEMAAQLIAMPLSALMLLNFLNVSSGDWVIQNAANGLVGTILADIAKSRGVNVISLVRRTETIAEMAAKGIGNVIATDTPDWQKQVRELTGGKPIRAGVDSVGGKASGAMLHLLGEDSTLVSFGSMTGEAMEINSGDLIFKNTTVKGFWAARLDRYVTPEQQVAAIGEVVRLAMTGVIKLPVDGIFDVADAAKATAESLKPGRKGKVLIRP